MNIYQKLIEVRKTVPYLQKENSGGQYKYVSSSQVLASCIEKMNEIGLLLVPNILSHKINESVIEAMDDKGRIVKRTTTYFTELDIMYTWINADKPDETIQCAWYGQGVDIAGEKGVGKALTYAEKYFLLKSFNIATDKDDPDAFQEKNEEKSKDDKKPKSKTPPITPPQQDPLLITSDQRKLMFATAESNEVKIKEVIGKYGYTSTKEIKKSDFDKILNDLK